MGVLRCCLALSVLLVHDMEGWFKLIDGAAAVQCFFLISGFYMALVLHERYSDLRAFYFNRALRLFPTYWAVVLLILAAAMLAGRPNFIEATLQGDLTWDARALVFVSSFALIGSDAMLFVRPTQTGLVFTADFWREPPQLFWFHPVPPAWSLPVEMAFYVLAPFLVRSRWRLLGMVLLGLVVRIIVYMLFGSHDPWLYRFFPAELAVFCAGGLAYHFYRRIALNAAARSIGVICLGMLIAAMLVLSTPAPDGSLCADQRSRTGLSAVCVCPDARLCGGPLDRRAVLRDLPPALSGSAIRLGDTIGGRVDVRRGHHCAPDRPGGRPTRLQARARARTAARDHCTSCRLGGLSF